MIVKVSKLLGFSGFRNLRAALIDYFSQSEQVLPAELFDEAPQDVVNKVFNITLRTIMEGQSIVNVDEIHRAARFFAQANQRDLYGAAAPTPSAPTCSISFYASACAARHTRTRTS
jgi:DNA-binding MurR/RpiR family transcriptional regulator